MDDTQESEGEGVAGDRDTAGPLRRLVWNDRERRPRTPWRLLAGVVGVFVALSVVGLGARLLPTSLDGGRYLPALYSTFLYLGATAVVVAGLLFTSYAVDRRQISDLGLQLDRQWWRDAVFGLFLGAVLPSAVFLVELAAGLVTVTGVLVTDPDALLSFGAAPLPLALIAIVLVFVGVSVSEEVFVRGYLLTNVAEGLAGWWRFGTRAALVIATVATGAVFGVLHASNPNATPLSILNITLFGVFIGLGYVWTERLGVPIGMHLTWNAVVGAGYGYPVSGLTVGVTVLEVEQRGPAVITGGSFGPEGGLVALLALALGLGLLGWWVRREYGTIGLMDAVAVPTLRDRGDQNHD